MNPMAGLITALLVGAIMLPDIAALALTPTREQVRTELQSKSNLW